MEKMNNPKVFICHAGEDNVFAKALGEALLKNGVDAWVDDWEIQLGDKLFQKVFPRIAECDVFIIVLSRDSVEKPWIKEELDAALVMRMENQTKLIPIRIDDCEVPLTLKATAWETIDPGKDIEGQIEPILTSIFNKTIKPELGEIPERFQDAEKVDDLDIVETAVLKSVLALYENQGEEYISGDQIQEETGYSPDQINDAVEICKNKGLFNVEYFIGEPSYNFGIVKITSYAYMKFAPDLLNVDAQRECIEFLSYLVSKNDALVIEELEGDADITLKPTRLNIYVDYLDVLGRVEVIRTMSTHPYSFYQVEANAEGRRSLRNV